VKVPEVKHSAKKGSEVQDALLALDGVYDVKANPTTGNVLVLFESERVDHHRILFELRAISCLDSPVTSSSSGSHRIVQTVMHSALQIALERMLLALL